MENGIQWKYGTSIYILQIILIIIVKIKYLSSDDTEFDALFKCSSLKYSISSINNFLRILKFELFDFLKVRRVQEFDNFENSSQLIR